MTQGIGNGIQSLSPQVNSYNLKQSRSQCHVSPVCSQISLWPPDNSCTGTLEPQQAGGKPLALISGTSRRMRKPRNSSGKYGMLLKSVRGNVSVKKLRENGLQQLFILYGAGNICGLEATWNKVFTTHTNYQTIQILCPMNSEQNPQRAQTNTLWCHLCNYTQPSAALTQLKPAERCVSPSQKQAVRHFQIC